MDNLPKDESGSTITGSVQGDQPRPSASQPELPPLQNLPQTEDSSTAQSSNSFSRATADDQSQQETKTEPLSDLPQKPDLPPLPPLPPQTGVPPMNPYSDESPVGLRKDNTLLTTLFVFFVLIVSGLGIFLYVSYSNLAAQSQADINLAMTPSQDLNTFKRTDASESGFGGLKMEQTAFPQDAVKLATESGKLILTNSLFRYMLDLSSTPKASLFSYPNTTDDPLEIELYPDTNSPKNNVTKISAFTPQDNKANLILEDFAKENGGYLAGKHDGEGELADRVVESSKIVSHKMKEGLEAVSWLNSLEDAQNASGSAVSDEVYLIGYQGKIYKFVLTVLDQTMSSRAFANFEKIMTSFTPVQK